MFVDVHLDQLDLAVGGPDRLLERRRELAAGAAPRRPEVDQHRLALRFLDDILHEGLGCRLLDQTFHRLRRRSAALLYYCHGIPRLVSCRVWPVLARPEGFGTCLLLSGGWGRNFNRSKRWLRRVGDLGPVRIARPICGVFALFPGVAGHGGRPQVPAFRGLLHSWAAFGIALTVAGAPIAASFSDAGVAQG